MTNRIKESFLVEAAQRFSKAAGYLETWRKVVKAAAWRSLPDVRKTYPSADGVKVGSGRNVTVFNICGNEFRLIVAIHYNRQAVFTLLFLTHAEDSKDDWKDSL